MQDNIIAVIQARMNSKRLPGKVLMPLAGRNVLEHVAMRVRKAHMVSEVIVATSINEEDAKIAEACEKLGVRVFRGSEEDVLDRFYRASLPLNSDHVVRITADCPMIDPEVIDSVIARHIKVGTDYTSNTLEPTYPDGEDVEVFKMSALEKAWKNAKLSSEREHVTPYIRNNPQVFKLLSVVRPGDLSGRRWTLDEDRDYRFLKEVFDSLYHLNNFFGITDILKFLEKNPRVEKINSCILRNEGYRESLKKDRTIKNG